MKLPANVKDAISKWAFNRAEAVLEEIYDNAQENDIEMDVDFDSMSFEENEDFSEEVFAQMERSLASAMELNVMGRQL